MNVTFDFFDRKFFKHEMSWSCKMTSIPRIGDEISLPALENGGPLYHRKFNASHAMVESIVWRLEDEEVSIYCHIVWEK